MFCTKFTLSADGIQVLNVITCLGFTLSHWHKMFVDVYYPVNRDINQKT